ncbi:MAG: transporter substrate-binding domain-containing protein [Lachnospiraceae bacterium]|nr:transporter substrate-binding domain-containing protein [Lachnospiraceae bacterium]
MKNTVIKKLLAVTVLASFALAGCGKAASVQPASIKEEVTVEEANETPAAADNGEVRKIVVSHSAASWPYNVLTADGESDGYEVAVLKAVDELLPQYEFVFEATGDDSDLLIGVQTGKYQIGIKGAWWTEERSTKYLFPEHYIAASVTGIAFRTENADKIKDMQSFADFSGLLVPLAPQNAQYTIIENYNKNNPDHQIILEPSDNFAVSEQYQWVLEGRYDAAFVIQTAFESIVEAEDGEYHQYADELSYVAYEGIPTYPLFPLGEEDLVKAYDEAWEELLANGTLDALQEKYFGYNIYDLVPAGYQIGDEL